MRALRAESSSRPVQYDSWSDVHSMMSGELKERAAEFFGKEKARLVRYVRRLLRDSAELDGEDIVQDVMASLFDRADITAPVENLSTFVYRSLYNRVVDRYRRRKTAGLPLDMQRGEGRSFQELSDTWMGSAEKGFFMNRTPLHRGIRLVGWVLFGVAAAAMFALVFGIVVMLLWNWLMPDIFGVTSITYLQAFGLVILAKLIFGAVGRGHHPHDRPRWMDRSTEMNGGDRGGNDA